MKTCSGCNRELQVGESAWVDDVLAIHPDGVRYELRYACDGCHEVSDA